MFYCIFLRENCFSPNQCITHAEPVRERFDGACPTSAVRRRFPRALLPASCDAALHRACSTFLAVQSSGEEPAAAFSSSARAHSASWNVRYVDTVYVLVAAASSAPSDMNGSDGCASINTALAVAGPTPFSFVSAPRAARMASEEIAPEPGSAANAALDACLTSSSLSASTNPCSRGRHFPFISFQRMI